MSASEETKNHSGVGLYLGSHVQSSGNGDLTVKVGQLVPDNTRRDVNNEPVR